MSVNILCFQVHKFPHHLGFNTFQALIHTKQQYFDAVINRNMVDNANIIQQFRDIMVI